MMTKREKIEQEAIEYFGMEHEYTIYIFKLLEQYEDNEHNNRCIREILQSLISLEMFKRRYDK